jgi:hypothetical protein
MGMGRAGLALLFVCGAVGPVPPSLEAAELHPATVAAFDRYVELTEARMAAEIAGTVPFLWVDRQPEPVRHHAMVELEAGRVVVERLETRDGRQAVPVPDGLVHHWIGTVFLPGVRLERALGFVRNYEGYPTAFGPMIQSARVRSATEDHVDVTIRTSTRQVVTVVVEADYAVDYRAAGPGRVWTKSIASHIQEIDAPGTPTERVRPPADDHGYLWRLNTYCAFEARPDGTYEQCESISLSRGVPFGFGWLVGPLVEGVPRETLEFTLGHVRAALVGHDTTARR